MITGPIYKIQGLSFVSEDVIQPEPARTITNLRTQNEGPIFCI